MSKHCVSLDNIRRAAPLLRDVVHRTPILENAEVNALLGGRLLLKAENFQRTGAFKIRGAYYRISQMSPAERARGVVTYSSGNHALGVALAAQLLESSAIIVMPRDVPEAKMTAVRALGAKIVAFERDTKDSATIVAAIEAETGCIEVPPSAHPQVLAGAGTAALELLEDTTGPLDTVLVPCGGGGLTAATAVVMAEAAPQTQVYSAEPLLFNDTQRSLEAGERVRNPKGQRTICDAIMTPIPNTVTFPINHALLAGGVAASDAEVLDAMRFAFEHFKIVAEPGAVVGLAAVLSGRVDIKDRSVATVITGGNIALSRFAALLEKKHDT